MPLDSRTKLAKTSTDIERFECARQIKQESDFLGGWLYKKKKLCMWLCSWLASSLSQHICDVKVVELMFMWAAGMTALLCSVGAAIKVDCPP